MNDIPVVYPTYKKIKRRINDDKIVEIRKQTNISAKESHYRRIEIMKIQLDQEFPDITPELKAEYEEILGFNKPFVPVDEEFEERNIQGEYVSIIQPVITEYYL